MRLRTKILIVVLAMIAYVVWLGLVDLILPGGLR